MNNELILKNQINSRRKFLHQSGLVFASVLTASALPAFATFDPTKSAVIKVGVIGCGNRGAGLISLMKGISGLQVTACCDIVPAHVKNALTIAGRSDIKTYMDYRQLVDDKNVDAVIIATPLFLHYPLALYALQAKKHIYLEKSMTYDIPQSIDLAKKVKDAGVVFQVGYQYRYYNLYHKVKQVIKENWLGKVTHFECQYHRNSNWRVPVSDAKMERVLNWRMYREYCGGPLSELCAHQIDAVNFMLDAHPLKAIGMGGIDYWKDGRDTYDNIRTVYEYPNGIKASFSSVLSNAFNGYGVRILGDKATVEIQRDKALIYAESLSNARGIVDGVSGATITNATQGQQQEIPFKKSADDDLEPTVLSLRDFVTCITQNKKPASNADTAHDSSIAIHMGNKAADTETTQTWIADYNLKQASKI